MKVKKLLSALIAGAMALSCFGFTAFADESGFVVNTETKTATVSSVEGLKTLAENVNDGNSYSGYTITLTEDIDLAGVEWTPIGADGKPFQGTFDGGNHIISNLTINNENLVYAGLFGSCSSNPGEIRNVNLNNVSIKAKSNIGAIAGASFTTKVTDCKVTGLVQLEGNYKVAGISGGHTYGKVTNCSVNASDGSYIKATYTGNDLEGDNVGGIVGLLGEGSSVVTGCSVYNVAISGVRKVGGIAGFAYSGNTISNCTVENVTVSYNGENVPSDYSKVFAIGGIVGSFLIDNKNINNKLALDSISLDTVTVTGREDSPQYAGLYIGSDYSPATNSVETTMAQVNMSGVTATSSNAMNADCKYDGVAVSTENAGGADGIEETKATGFITTITGNSALPLNNITWDVTYNGTTKSTTEHALNNITTDGGTVQIGLIVKGFNDNDASAVATINGNITE